MQNVEFKAELRDLELARSVCTAIGARYIQTLHQTDTYYRVEAGRLKKREAVGEQTEWIFYERPDDAAAKLSRFKIYSEEEAGEEFGGAGMAVWVVVKKRRELYMLGNVRIHLDDVEGLGRFIEFEALVTQEGAGGMAGGIEECRRRVMELRRELGPALGEAVGVGYSDLLGAEG